MRIGCDTATDPDQTVVSFGPGCPGFTVSELTRLAAGAKTKVQATARGWSMLSREEIQALAWFAHLFLEDTEPGQPAPIRPEPPEISHV